MLLLHSKRASVAVVIAGRGLIGTAVERSILRWASYTARQFAFPWDADADAVRARCTSQLLDSLEQIADQDYRVHTVWSAGSAGFAAEEPQTRVELDCYRQIVAFAESVQGRMGVPSHLHVLSSAGGLFEGVRGIDATTTPCPVRPYGKLKLAQEEMAVNAMTASTSVYRPTSVFSTFQPGKRRGLIPTMIWNALRNQTTRIYGDCDTLRDYIWADDVGGFIADRIVNSRPHSQRQQFLLATGIPTPIFRIIQAIESMLMRKVPVQFTAPTDNNTLDITVCPHSIPRGLRTTDLASAIRRIYMQLASDGMLPNG